LGKGADAGKDPFWSHFDVFFSGALDAAVRAIRDSCGEKATLGFESVDVGHF
jgi:hypothetical protein